MMSLSANSWNAGTTPGTAVLPKDIRALTGIRFFAALWVVLFHFREELALIKIFEPFKGVVALGYLAVPMFFILSGFILSHTYFASYSLKCHAEFVYRRFARLWPMHVASIIALVIYMGVIVAHSGQIKSDNYPWDTLPLEVAMIRCWISKELLWNYPAWSIHAEWFAYLFVFPVALGFFRKSSYSPSLVLMTIFLLLGAVVFPVTQIPGQCAEIVFLFLAGSALYRLRVLHPSFAGKWCVNVGLLILGVAISSLFAHALELIYCAFGLIIFGLSYQGGWLEKFLSFRPIVYGGVISYSMYMTHAIVLKFFAAGVHKFGMETQGMRIVGAFIFIGAVLATASASYHLIEAPCNVMLRKRSPFPAL